MKKNLLLVILFFSKTVLYAQSEQADAIKFFKAAIETKSENKEQFIRYFKSGEIALLDNKNNIENLSDSVLFYYGRCLYIAGNESINIGEDSYKKAIPYLEKCASQNNYDCNFYMGRMYQLGLGVDKNEDIGIDYYKKAIGGGSKSAVALNNLGSIYQDKNNFELAFSYYTKSAALDYGLAWSNLGWLYSEGDGVKMNKSKAFECFKNGENLKDERNRFALGLGHCYSFGDGVAVDFLKAMSYYRIASKNSSRANGRIGFMFENGQGVSINLDSTEYYYKKGSRKENDYFTVGDTWSAFSLGLLYDKYKEKFKGNGSQMEYLLSKKDYPRAGYNLALSRYVETDFYYTRQGSSNGVLELLLEAYENKESNDNLKYLCAFNYAKIVYKHSIIDLYPNALSLLKDNENADDNGEITNLLAVYFIDFTGAVKMKETAKYYFDKSIKKGFKQAAENKKNFGL